VARQFEARGTVGTLNENDWSRKHRIQLISRYWA